MEFGKTAQFPFIDYSFPQEDRKNDSIMKAESQTKLYLGAPRWANPDWKGILYPHDAKPSEYLHYYAQRFNSIEMNSTFYATPAADIIKKWKEQVPSHFKFVCKIPKRVSHRLMSSFNKEELLIFLRKLYPLKENLGPFFLQLPETFSLQHFSKLQEFFSAWPHEHLDISVEMRHPSWFNSGSLTPKLRDLLEENQACALITDVAGRRDVLHTSMTNQTVVLRFVGNALHKTDYKRLNDWMDFYQKRQSQIKEFYFLMHQPDTALAPHASQWLMDEMVKKSLVESPVCEPMKKVVEEQPMLF